ncbi:hypothetical protein IE53DRAFT_29610 [Violaceomyces palustris]|uniref:Uncharacterized protein n=1 Tax=Violaceomyces palustris TaxID=1673888 RepID=A0ACD0P1M7_9BASI|nr:hypothetical protein IE53DRAFT_29610 [Violaceomyces palustris]
MCCFNCGQSGHSFSKCTAYRDPENIKRNRELFMSNKLNRSNLDVRLHDSEASRKFRLLMMSTLKPGHPSEELRNALGLSIQHTRSESQGPDSVSSTVGEGGQLCTQMEEGELSENASFVVAPAEEPSYLRRMLIWGYPPGWISREDPIAKIRQRLVSDNSWNTAQTLEGFDIEAARSGPRQDRDQNRQKETPGPSIRLEPASEDLPIKRWVDYQTGLFDSSKLEPFDVLRRTPLQFRPERRSTPPGRDQQPDNVAEQRRRLWDDLIRKHRQAQTGPRSERVLTGWNRPSPYAHWASQPGSPPQYSWETRVGSDCPNRVGSPWSSYRVDDGTRTRSNCETERSLDANFSFSPSWHQPYMDGTWNHSISSTFPPPHLQPPMPPSLPPPPLPPPPPEEEDSEVDMETSSDDEL